MNRNLLFSAGLAFLTACAATDTLELNHDDRLPAQADKSKLDLSISAAELKKIKSFGDNEVVLLQVNDVYEVEPSEAGTRGGLARLAWIRAMLGSKVKPVQVGSPSAEAAPQRVLSILPGDFISPSAIGASREMADGPTYKKGDYVAGRHMIAGLRAAGMDVVSFGNHEFDRGKNPQVPVELYNRIAEFVADRPAKERGKIQTVGTLPQPKWLAGNVQLKDPAPASFPQGYKEAQKPMIWDTEIQIRGKSYPVKVGVFAICLPWATSYATFEMPVGAKEDVYASARRQIDELKSRGANLIIAMTHQSMESDREFAAKFKNEIHLVAGGHEHDRQFDAIARGVKNELPHLMVTKADANGKSAYIHRFAFDLVNGEIKPIAGRSLWIDVNAEIPDIPFVREITQSFEAQAKASFRKEKLTEDLNYAPDRVIWKTKNDLDGRESKIRTQKTHLSELIGRSITAKAYRLQKQIGNKAGSPVIGAIYHGGTIRIDDRLMSPKALEGVLSSKSFRAQQAECEMPSNCRPVGDPRCEKKVRCPGDITEYDVLRVAPFPETVLTWMQISGRQISFLYGCNDHNGGTGSYLHFINIFRCSQDASKLCYLKQDPDLPEFQPSIVEVPIQPSETYSVASLDYLSHIAFPGTATTPGHVELKKMGPIGLFPDPKDLIDPATKKKNAKWVQQNDIRRLLVEEPNIHWVNRVISDTDIAKSAGYGPQEPNTPAEKQKACVFK